MLKNKKAGLSGKRAITLIELIITMTSLSVIALAAGTVIIYLWREFIYIPRQLKTGQVGQAVLDEIAEGVESARGLRLARSITGATVSRVDYTYGYPAPGDVHNVTIRWDNTAKRFYRAVDGGPEAAIPYYSTGTSVQGKAVATTVFTYYKANDAPWISGVDPLNQIKRAQFDINVITGSGSFAGYEGNLTISSGIEIKQY